MTRGGYVMRNMEGVGENASSPSILVPRSGGEDKKKGAKILGIF